MTTVRTNLGNTRERAGQLRFEPVGSISATNVQDAIAEVAAEALPVLTTPTVIAANGPVAVTDVVVQGNKAGALALTLPASAAWAAQNSKYGLPLSISDISGLASVNNITITPNGAETIGGNASLTINADFGTYQLYPKSGGGWVFL